MITSNTHLRSVSDRDGAVILDMGRDAISTLNSTGAYVWEGLEQGKLIEEIIENLARETGADPGIVGRDVHAFHEELKLNHLLPH